MSLERAIEYIGADEYVEATPKSLRFAQAHPRRDRAEARHRGGRLVWLTNHDFLGALRRDFSRVVAMRGARIEPNFLTKIEKNA